MLRRISFGRLAGFFVIVAALGLVFLQPLKAQDQLTPKYQASHDVVPFVPTPMPVVERMLELAKVTPKDVVYDLGSGDGRIVILAAQKFGAHAVGVQLDPGLYHKSWARIEELGLASKAKLLYGNMFQADVHAATVVTLYLLPGVNEDIRPMLEKQLRPGTRVVSHDFRIASWDAVKSEHVTVESVAVHTIYLYIRP